MWSGQDKVWMHYLNDIISAELASAVFLSSYLRRSARSLAHAPALEVLDLQKYKVISKGPKVKNAMRSRLHVPFVFLVGKN
jgi:hypothetical protein